MPSYSRQFKLGTSVFPLGTSVDLIDRGKTIGSQKMARAQGMSQTIGYRNGVRFELAVPVYKGPLDDSEHRPRIDDLLEILAQGPERFYLYDDRYYRCVECVTDPEEIIGSRFGNIHNFRVSLIGPDPFQYSTEEETDTWTSPANGSQRTITVAGGKSPAAPEFTITVGGSGLVALDMELENTTTDESFNLVGSVTGGSVIVVDTVLKRVQIAGVDRIDLFDLLFPKLNVGGNAFTLTLTSGTISSIVTTWNERWE